jgi:hypothetical protein
MGMGVVTTTAFAEPQGVPPESQDGLTYLVTYSPTNLLT